MINADKDSVDIHCIWELDTARCRLNKTLEGFKRRSFKIKHISPLIDTDDYHGYYVKCDDDTGYIEYSYSIRFPKKEGAHILIIEEARLKNNKYISELPTTRYTTQPCILSEMRLERYSIEYIKSISEN